MGKRPGLGRQGTPLFNPLCPILQGKKLRPLLTDTQLVRTQSLCLPLQSPGVWCSGHQKQGSQRRCHLVLLSESFQPSFIGLRLRQSTSEPLNQNSGYTASLLCARSHRGVSSLHSSVFHQLFIGPLRCQGKWSLSQGREVLNLGCAKRTLGPALASALSRATPPLLHHCAWHWFRRVGRPGQGWPSSLEGQPAQHRD